MDKPSFDHIARLLAGPATRRNGIKALLGAALGIAALDDASAGKNSRETGGRDSRKHRGKRPALEGPCGNGSRRANICSSDSDCCTGLCNLKVSKWNDDRQGRCRCIRKGRPCAESRNCCNGGVCLSGKCGPAPVPVPLTQRCLPSDTCADANAVCSEYSSEDPAGTFCLLPNGEACTADNECIGGFCKQGFCDGKVPTGIACQEGDVCKNPDATCTIYRDDAPAGTYCLLPRGKTCTAPADCEGGDCIDGACASCSCRGCAEPCTPIVCASGCTYTTIQAAIDAASPRAVIAIGSGSYTEDLAITKDLTLRACPGATVTLANTTYGNRAITVTRQASLELIDITIAGYSDFLNSNKGGGVTSDGNVKLCRNTVIRTSYATAGGGLEVIGSGREVIIADQTVIEQNSSDSYGGGVYLKGDSLLKIRDAAVVKTNHAKKYGGGVTTYGATNTTISDQALIDANSTDSYGGNLATFAWTSKQPYRLLIRDDAVISNGTSKKGGGGLYVYGQISTGVEARIEMRDRAKITGNTNDVNDGGGKDGGGIYMWEGTFSMYDDSELSNNSASGAGGGIYIAPSTGSPWWITTDLQFLMAGNAKISGNTGNRVASSSTANVTNSGGGVYLYSMKGEMRDNAEISGNTAEYGGGMQMLNGFGTSSTLTMKGSSKITGNTATAANGGGGVEAKWVSGTAPALTITDSASVTGNTPDQCSSETSGGITC